MDQRECSKRYFLLPPVLFKRKLSFGKGEGAWPEVDSSLNRAAVSRLRLSLDL